MLFLDFLPLHKISNFKFQISNLRPLGRLVWEKTPFLVLSVLFSVITFLVHKQAGVLRPVEQLAVGTRIGDALVAYLRYLGKTFWPVNLSIFHPSQGQWPLVLVLSALAAVVGMSLAAIWLRRTRPYLFVGWFWFLGTLLPVIGLVKWLNLSICEHFTYLPLVGVYVLFAWAAGDLMAKRRWSRHGGTLAGLVAVFVLAACTLRTRNQLRYWRDSETLYSHALRVTKDNWVAHDSLGTVLAEQGRLAEAATNYHCALAIKPDDLDAWNNLGAVYFEEGRLEEVVRLYQRAIQLRPDCEDLYYNLALVFAAQGRLEESVLHYQQALELRPDYQEAHYNLALVFVAQGRLEDAIRSLAQAIEFRPDDADAQYHLGVVLARQGRAAAAREHFRRALELKPDYAEATEQLRALGGNAP
jgi:protein O-mannosyl-transferase